MTTKLKLHLLLLALLSLAGFAHAQGTAISYQGRLNDGGLPATGLYDFTFHVFDAEVDGTDLAGPLGPLPFDAVPVSNGLFNVTLDFGPDIFSGSARWLEISVRANGVGDPIVLTPRTPLLPTPYAIFAGKAGSVVNGTVTADQLNSGGVPPVPGQFLSYDGGNFLWRDPVVDSVWSVLNNNAYYNSGNVGIGTESPVHRLAIAGGPLWTSESWAGSIELGNGAAIGWAANAAGQRFGMGHSTSGFGFFRTISDLGTTGDPPLYDLFINDLGAVSIGTAAPNPGYRLVVNGGVQFTPGGLGGTMQFGTPNSETGMTWANASTRADLRFDGSTVKLLAGPAGGPPSNASGIAVTTAGNVGIGTASPQAKLHVSNPGGSVSHRIQTGGGINAWTRVDFANANGQWNVGTSRGFNSDQFYFAREGAAPVFSIQPNGDAFVAGTMSCKVLTIRGGADVAEPFGMPDEIAKGSVVVIDDARPGQLKLSAEAYDTRVAGIVSGANGINPGIALHQEGALEGGQNVALSGRVYVQADASFGAIKPGDLLTTSDTPGHAMKVTEHSKAQGAILGKAMSGLSDGKGMVLVLVTLQ